MDGRVVKCYGYLSTINTLDVLFATMVKLWLLPLKPHQKPQKKASHEQ